MLMETLVRGMRVYSTHSSTAQPQHSRVARHTRFALCDDDDDRVYNLWAARRVCAVLSDVSAFEVGGGQRNVCGSPPGAVAVVVVVERARSNLLFAIKMRTKRRVYGFSMELCIGQTSI